MLGGSSRIYKSLKADKILIESYHFKTLNCKFVERSTYLQVNMSTSEASVTQPLVATNQRKDDSAVGDHEHHQLKALSAHGLTLQMDFVWSKFRNTISEKNGEHLTPLYVQHFRPLKPQLRFNSADDTTQIASGTINNFSIAGECTVNNRTIELKPLKRWKTQYNYLSHAFAHPSEPNKPVPISWIASTDLKTWDFVCLDAQQLPIAKFAVNLWALVQTANFYFEKRAEEISKEMRDEVVVTGTTIVYLMTVRANNPLHLLGAAFAKPGKVGESSEEVELEDRKHR
jgi:hypothetical protein